MVNNKTEIVEAKRRNLYGSAMRLESAREQLAEAPGLLRAWEEDYSKSFAELNFNVEHCGGVSKLEDDSGKFAAKLRESEGNLRNDLGGRSFFKKRMDVGKYWDGGLLEEFRDFEGVVDTNYKSFVGDVYAKLDKNGDVLVSRNRKVGFAKGIVVPGIFGVAGVIYGGLFVGISESIVKTVLAMERVSIEPGSNLIYTGAIGGAIGATAFMYYAVRGKLTTFVNPLSDGADDLGERVSVIKKALDLRGE